MSSTSRKEAAALLKRFGIKNSALLEAIVVALDSSFQEGQAAAATMIELEKQIAVRGHSQQSQ